MIRESPPAISAVSLETGTDALAVADRRFWASQGHLDGAPVFIPLHTHPEDWEFTRLLAESVMCGKETVTCRVIFSRSYIDAARLDPGLER